MPYAGFRKRLPVIGALELKPDDGAVYMNLGNALQDMEKPDEAIACYRRALEITPGNADVCNNLGNTLRSQGKLDQAVAYYRRALDLRSDFAEAHNNLGVALKQQGKADQAIVCWRRALELKPLIAETHSNLGNALRERGKPEDAIACYHRALELRPDYAEAHGNLGNALQDLGRLEEAVASYRRAVDLKPEFAEAHNNLGVFLKNLGRLDEAVASYRRAVELKPYDANGYSNLGVALKEQGELDEAIASCRRAVELRSDFAEAHNNLGVALKEQGRLLEAVACCRRALELKPNFAEAYSNLANALRELGKLDEAVVCYRRALDLKPHYAEAHSNLGNVLKDQGKLDEAVAAYRRALELKPDFAEAHGNLGSVLRGDRRASGGRTRLPCLLALQSAMRVRALQTGVAPGWPSPGGGPGRAARGLLEEKRFVDAQRLLLHFGLAQVLDARGEYAGPAAHLARGNALQSSELRKHGREYDPKAYELLVARMISVCTPEFFARVRGFGLRSELPVFVIGLPRSGTTLIEQILAGHSQVYAAGEIKLAQDTMDALGGQGEEAFERHAPVEPPDGLRPRIAAPGKASRLESHCPPHRRQDAGELPVPGAVGNSVSAGEVHSLPPRYARRGRIVLDDAFPGSSLGQRRTAHSCPLPRIPTRDGTLAEGSAGSSAGRGLRRDRGRPGRRGAKAPGLVRPRVGTEVHGVPPVEASRLDGQRRTSPPAGLQHIGGKMEALRTGPRFTLRPAGRHGRRRGRPPPSRPTGHA